MKKAKRKPKYSRGVVYSGKYDTITVKKIYHPGHRYASETEYGYLIHSWDRGEDELLEPALGTLISQSAYPR